MKKPTITEKEIEKLKKQGRVVHVYPRKNMVRVDGFKWYVLKKR